MQSERPPLQHRDLWDMHLLHEACSWVAMSAAARLLELSTMHVGPTCMDDHACPVSKSLPTC
jgi:hypothetical protein